MDEELSKHDLEERLYGRLQHIDETQNILNNSHQNKSDDIQLTEHGPRSTLRRYWHTNPYQKINIPKVLTPPTVSKNIKDPAPPTVFKIIQVSNDAAKESSPPKPPSQDDLSIFHSPVPQNVKKTIEFLDHEEVNPVVLESSDDDEVVEVALPPKPTITIESSDEDELNIVKEESPVKSDPKCSSGDRAVTASPVQSVVSSVCDEFIRSDCIELNISSRHPDKHSFDFSLHGSDLLGQTKASSKKKKRKKNKEAVTSTPIVITADELAQVADACFATPKSKDKNKKQRSRLTIKSLSNPDVYDSDSNLFTADIHNSKNPYIVTEKSLPSVDVYESDSNQSEKNTDQSKNTYTIEAYSSDSNISDHPEETPVVSKKSSSQPDAMTVDLTENDSYITIDTTGICDNIVIGNVTGFTESMDYGEEDITAKGNISMFVSSKVPSILNDNLDFDNLKGNEKICKKRRYSLTTLRAEMEKFYNESWGGEDFNHKEIQKNMSRDKSLWAIDPKDRMPFTQRKAKCNYCNRVGHKDDTCCQKPPICYMCGTMGHFEPHCPTKICVNCGSPNFMYSTMCRNCSSWPRVQCAECGQFGHPASHCPDLWRRYHNTIGTDMSLAMCTQVKKPYQQFCSGCARRGHLIHTCRISLPFSGLPINSPHVQLYRPIYAQTCEPGKPLRSKSFSEDTRQERNVKRLSKSPTVHDTHLNKRRNVSAGETPSPALLQKNRKEVENTPKNKYKTNQKLDPVSAEKVPSSVPVHSSNHDNKGRVIQDNEVSDTSDAVTSARIYITNDIIAKLKAKEGEDWLKATTGKLNVTVKPADVNSFLSITGKLADQEMFQAELREWVQTKPNKLKNTSGVDVDNSDEPKYLEMIPKARTNLLELLHAAFKSLNNNFGDPKFLHRELLFFQSRHEKLLKHKIISPQKLLNIRTRINNFLKRLNIVLLGQAGLADGSEHLNKLLSFKEKLTMSQEKYISIPLRKEIGQHYHCIFTPSARSDYPKLMKTYYSAKTKLAKEKKKLKRKKKAAQVNTVDKRSIPSEATDCVENMPPPTIQNQHSEAHIPLRQVKCQRELFLLRKKLTALRKSGVYTKDGKVGLLRLLRKIHQSIEMLHQNKSVTSKQMKKTEKWMLEARSFMSKM